MSKSYDVDVGDSIDTKNGDCDHGTTTHVPIAGRNTALIGCRCISHVNTFIKDVVKLDQKTCRRWAQECSASYPRYYPHTSNGPLDALPNILPAATSPDTRRARSATALKQITNLQARRSQPGNLPLGQTTRRTPRESIPYDSDNFGASVADPKASNTRANSPPRFAKFSGRPTATHGSAPPAGQMVRAPSALRTPRTPNAGGIRGPNLGGRSAGRGGPRGSKGPGGREQGPKKRERKKAGDTGAKSTSIADADPAETLSDGMVHHLLRLQRKEWDRVPYEPKYAPGSFAAQELIHEGRELFRGEAPPVKIWGELEKRIGVVGMFGAEAQLKVRRVGDGDEVPFGKEHELDEERGSEQQEGNNKEAVQ